MQELHTYIPALIKVKSVVIHEEHRWGNHLP